MTDLQKVTKMKTKLMEKIRLPTGITVDSCNCGLFKDVFKPKCNECEEKNE